MAEGARVDSISALTEFKAVLWKFREAAQRALGDADSEMQRILVWLESEQDSHWQHQIRKCQETVVRCKEAVRMKTVFKDASGRQQSAVDEQKALQIAMRKLAEAEEKLKAVRRWSRQLQKEIGLYKGSVQRFATSVQSEIPAAAAHLESLATKLDAYASLSASSGAAGGIPEGILGAAGTNQGSMARSPDAGSPADRRGFAVPTIPQEHQAGLAGLAVQREMPAPDATVRIDPEARAAGRLVFRRDERGWSVIGSEATQTSAETDLISVREILALRPDFQDLLALPTGFSVIIGGQGVVSVHDERAANLWVEHPIRPSDTGTHPIPAPGTPGEG